MLQYNKPLENQGDMEGVNSVLAPGMAKTPLNVHIPTGTYLILHQAVKHSSSSYSRHIGKLLFQLLQNKKLGYNFETGNLLENRSTSDQCISRCEQANYFCNEWKCSSKYWDPLGLFLFMIYYGMRLWAEQFSMWVFLHNLGKISLDKLISHSISPLGV